MKDERTVEDDIQDALNEIEGATEEVSEDEEVIDDAVEEAEEEVAEEEPQEEVEADVETDEQAPAEEAPVVDEESEVPPQSWSGLQKERWKDIPAEARKYINQREKEFHAAVTKHDEERLFGKTMKDQFTPYMPLIESEGGTPEGAVRDYLNMAYIMRQGSPQQKAELVRNTMQQFNIDPRAVIGQQGQQQQGNNVPPQVMQELQELKAKIAEKDTLQEQQEYSKVQEEITAFETNPANIYYNDVKAEMAALLQNGVAASLEDAYEKAIWAHPQIRSSLIAKQEATAKQERKKAVEAKKKAASSVKGSPDKSSANNQKNTDTYVDPTSSVEAAFKELESSGRV